MADEIVDISNRFVVVSRAAKGGMGVIYKAHDRQTGAFVAIKLMHGGDRENVLRFEREANILATLSHPGIVSYVAHGSTTDGKPFLAMEWVEGETLQDRLERSGLAIDEALELGRRVASALGYAHERGVVHRDIKPTNLLLRDRELSRVSLLDFGVARAQTVGSLTATGSLVGTPAYMAPEQARGVRELGPPADVFALGCVIYECLTGRRAFEGKHLLALIAKVVLWDPPRARSIDPQIPEAFDEVLARMIAKDPALRPRDGNEVAALLAPIVAPASATRRGHTAPMSTAIVRHATAPTISTSERRIASIVVAAPPDAANGELSDETLTTDTRLTGLELGDLRCEVLRDGSILAAITGSESPVELVTRAVRCARQIRRAAPDALIAIATGEIGDGDLVSAVVETLVEDTVGALAREAMALLFAGVAASSRPDGAIRIDDRTAAMLPAEAVVRVKTSCYVRPEGTP